MKKPQAGVVGNKITSFYVNIYVPRYIVRVFPYRTMACVGIKLLRYW